MKWNRFLIIALSISWLGVQAQTEEYLKYKERFPKEMAIRLQDRVDIQLEVDEDRGVVVRRKVSDETLLLGEMAGVADQRTIIYDAFTLIDEVEATSYVPSGSRYRKKRVKDFVKEDLMSDRVFYDDRKAIRIKFPDIRPGSKMALSFQEEFTNPIFLPPVYLQSGLFTQSRVITLEVPEDVEVRILGFNLDSTLFTYSREEKRGAVTHTWTLDSVPEYKRESSSPSRSYYVPHLAFIISDYKTRNGDRVPVLRGPKDLYGWYNGLMDSVDHQLGPDLIRIVDSIRQTGNDVMVASGLFNWVRNKIKYIAVEDGLGGFIPDAPAKVATKRYGDCKGMACLLANMMRTAGLDARECWIGTRDIPYSYMDVYTPYSDNHMITALQLNGEWLFLDPTDDYVPFGFPSSFIQGKEAMIRNGEDGPLIQKVPKMGSSANRSRIVDTLELTNGEIHGRGFIEFSGYIAARFLRNYDRVDKDKKEKFFQNYLETGHEKVRIDPNVHLHRSDSSARVDYRYELPDYVKSFERTLFVNLALDRYMSEEEIEDRELPYEIDYAHEYETIHYLMIPEGYQVKALPGDLDIQTSVGSATITYRQEGNMVVYRMGIQLPELMVQKNQFDEWNQLVKGLRTSYRKNLELIQNP
ncbi:MAG: DUF3857 domain-containing protein [Bacteroidota bacterium]|nr:DUF3857 domain-containing protein [Bacteroidota bacterium]